MGLFSAEKNIKVLSILILLGGIGCLLLTPVILLVLLVKPFWGIALGLISIGFIVSFFGLRKMKKWGLYVFTASVIIEILVTFYSVIILGATFPAFLILIFFWVNLKKFN